MFTCMGLGQRSHRRAAAPFPFSSTRTLCNLQDVAFPQGASELFATCSKGEIRVWQTLVNRELLRITVPNKVRDAAEWSTLSLAAVA